jgi:hypothetical protein
MPARKASSPTGHGEQVAIKRIVEVAEVAPAAIATLRDMVRVTGNHRKLPYLFPSLRANGSRECAPDDKLREAIHLCYQIWIASSLRSSQ